MFELNLIEALTASLIGTGFLLILTAWHAATRDALAVETLPEPPPTSPEIDEDLSDMDAAFEALVSYEPAPEIETMLEVPAEYIRPGDLLHTVKIPALVQTFKFREKKPQQPLSTI